MKTFLSAAALALTLTPALAGEGVSSMAGERVYVTRDAPRQTLYGEAQVYAPRQRSVRWLSEAYAPRSYFLYGPPRILSGRDPY